MPYVLRYILKKQTILVKSQFQMHLKLIRKNKYKNLIKILTIESNKWNTILKWEINLEKC